MAIVTLTGDNGILTQTQSAKEASDNSTAREKVQLEVLGSLGEEGKIDINNLNENLKNIEGLKYDGNLLSDTNKITELPVKVEVDGYTIFIDKIGTVKNIVDRPGINVGDYINYIPVGGIYEISKLDTYSGSTSNGSENLTLTNMGSLNWQVFRIYDDGRIDLIGTSTNKSINIGGVLGYNNGVYLMNDICKTLYSDSNHGIIARSINIEDIEYWLTDDIINEDSSITEGGKTARKNYQTGIKSYGDKRQYNATGYSYYPDIYQYQIGAGINTTNVKTTGISESDEYYIGGYDITKEKSLIDIREEGKSHHQANINGLTVEQTYYNILANNANYGNTSKVLAVSEYNAYWVASRCSDCDQYGALFGLRYVDSNVKGNSMFSSYYGNAYGGSHKLRPIVTLSGDAQITAVEGASTNSNTPHQITKY